MTLTAIHDQTLLNAVAHVCRRRTLVVSDGGAGFATGRRIARIQHVSPEDVARIEPPERFDSIVLLGVLEWRDDAAGDHLIETAWKVLATGGRLIVGVPNEDSIEDASQIRYFSTRSLRQLLRAYGRPVVVSEQPYRWLLMYVEKKERRQASVPTCRHARYEVMSRLCRGRVIELGCGSGELTAMISRRGHDVIGVDINRDKILAARQKFPAVRFEQQDIREIAVTGEHFDTVVLAEVLEHVSDAVGQDMLSVAWSLMRPGARLIVSVPNENCIPHPNHVRAFSRVSLRAMLEPLGDPRIVTDQPYKWLLMHVTKREDGAAARPSQQPRRVRETHSVETS